MMEQLFKIGSLTLPSIFMNKQTRKQQILTVDQADVSSMQNTSQTCLHVSSQVTKTNKQTNKQKTNKTKMFAALIIQAIFSSLSPEFLRLQGKKKTQSVIPLKTFYY